MLFHYISSYLARFSDQNLNRAGLPGVASIPISCSICSTAFTFFIPRLDGSFIRDDRKLVPELFVSGNLIPADSSDDASLVGLFDAMIPPEKVDFFFDDFLSAGVPTWARCYETFYGRNLQVLATSQCLSLPNPSRLV